MMKSRARVSREGSGVPGLGERAGARRRTREMLMREEKLSTRVETSASAFCRSDFCFCAAAAAAAAVGPGAEPAAPPALLIAVVARRGCCFSLCGLDVKLGCVG